MGQGTRKVRNIFFPVPLHPAASLGGAWQGLRHLLFCQKGKISLQASPKAHVCLRRHLPAMGRQSLGPRSMGEGHGAAGGSQPRSVSTPCICSQRGGGEESSRENGAGETAEERRERRKPAGTRQGRKRRLGAGKDPRRKEAAVTVGVSSLTLTASALAVPEAGEKSEGIDNRPQFSAFSRPTTQGSAPILSPLLLRNPS